MNDFEILLFNSNIKRLKEELAAYNEETKEKGGFIIKDIYQYIDIRTDYT